MKLSFLSIPKNINSETHSKILLLYFIIIFLCCSSYLISYASILAPIFFFFKTTWHTLKKVIIACLIISVICAIFPVLVPLAIIITIVFFAMRINFIIKNKIPFESGLLVYGSFFTTIALFNENSFSYNNILACFIIQSVISLLLTYGFHNLLKYNYAHGYTPERALGIMGLTPLLIIAFILPFLKLPVFTDGITLPDIHFSHPVIDTHPIIDGSGTHLPSILNMHHIHPSNNLHTTQIDSITSSHLSTGSSHNTLDGIVKVQSYIKSDGTIVKSYFRTTPDSITANNLSYNGMHNSLHTPSIKSADNLHHNTSINAHSSL